MFQTCPAIKNEDTVLGLFAAKTSHEPDDSAKGCLESPSVEQDVLVRERKPPSGSPTHVIEEIG